MNLPASQSVQLAAAAPLYLPPAQASHVTAPAPLEVPAAQSLQLALSAWPTHGVNALRRMEQSHGGNEARARVEVLLRWSFERTVRTCCYRATTRWVKRNTQRHVRISIAKPDATHI